MSHKFYRICNFPLNRVLRNFWHYDIRDDRKQLTRVKGNFAEQDPSRGEPHLELEEAADSVVEGDGDVDGELARPLDHGVDPHGGGLEAVTVQAQVDKSLGEHLRKNVWVYKNTLAFYLALFLFIDTVFVKN